MSKFISVNKLNQNMSKDAALFYVMQRKKNCTHDICKLAYLTNVAEIMKPNKCFGRCCYRNEKSNHAWYIISMFKERMSRRPFVIFFIATQVTPIIIPFFVRVELLLVLSQHSLNIFFASFMSMRLLNQFLIFPDMTLSKDINFPKQHNEKQDIRIYIFEH